MAGSFQHQLLCGFDQKGDPSTAGIGKKCGGRGTRSGMGGVLGLGSTAGKGPVLFPMVCTIRRGGKAMRGEAERNQKKGAVVWMLLLDWAVSRATLAGKHGE